MIPDDSSKNQYGISHVRSTEQNWLKFMQLCMDEVVAVPTVYFTPDIQSMWGYIVFAFPFVRSFVRTFVRSSQGRSFCIKVYKTSYFEDPLMDFIHIWHDGRYRSKVFISTVPTPGVTLGSRSRT